MRPSTKTVITVTTILQTFIMGTIDAYTFNTFNGSFVSAQTGNLIVFGIELATKGWHTAYIRVPVMVGFVLGAILAQAFRHLLLVEKKQFEFQLGISVVSLIALLTIATHPINDLVMLFLLGMFASYQLTLFNQVGETSVNNGIMTGNLKNMSNQFYEAIFQQDRTAMKQSLSLLVGIGMFTLGVLTSAYAMKSAPMMVFGIAAVINTGLLGLALFSVSNQPIRR